MMNLKTTNKAIGDSELTTYILVAFVLLTIVLGTLKILFL